MNDLNAKINTQNGSLLPDAFIKHLPRYNPGLMAIVRLPDLKVLFINDCFEHYLGYTKTDITETGLSFRELIEEHQLDHLLNQLKTGIDNVASRSAYVIYKLKPKNGTSMAFYVYTSPIDELHDTHGELHYLLMHPDLSKWGMPFTSFDSKDIFLEQFRGECFGTFEWIIDEDKIFCSPGIYQIYEIDPQSYIIRNFFAQEFIHPDDRARVAEATKLALANSTDLNIEYRIITGAKHTKLVHCLGRAIMDGKGSPVKFAGSIRDITEQRNIEDSLKNKMAALNQSNKELEEFAYVASHDMLEPLRKISTFSDRLSDKYKDILTGDGAMYLSRIIASAENMRYLINDLLEFSRVSSKEHSFEPTDLNEILRKAMTDLELTIEETGTRVTSPQLPVIDAVPSQMKQLFTNILNNAIKFRKEGVSPVISIDVAPLTAQERKKYELPASTTYHRISITDNGIGFEHEYATRIFQVFQRLHGKSEYPGSGIGLAICKKITEYHGGVIFAESTQGEGARFVFILPEHRKK